MSGSIETNPAIARPNAAHASIFEIFTTHLRRMMICAIITLAGGQLLRREHEISRRRSPIGRAALIRQNTRSFFDDVLHLRENLVFERWSVADPRVERPYPPDRRVQPPEQLAG